MSVESRSSKPSSVERIAFTPQYMETDVSRSGWAMM